MKKFENVTIILPAINETFSFEQTVDRILQSCNHNEICEFIAVVCKRTTKECLKSINKSKELSEEYQIPFTLLWQNRPFAGGAVQDAIDMARGSHLVMMSTDLETEPEVIPVFIEKSKKYPHDIM